MIGLDHKHLIVNANVEKPCKEGDESHIAGWLEHLIKEIGMKMVIPPRVHYCKADQNEGITASCNIETSHASLHVWDKLDPSLFRFDLYSCAAFSVDKVLELIMPFEPTKLEWIVLSRNYDIREVERGTRRFSS